MPGFDRTGPKGEGSKTGRGLGKCSPDKETNERGLGRGLGRGQGRGLGRRQGKVFGGGRRNRNGSS